MKQSGLILIAIFFNILRINAQDKPAKQSNQPNLPTREISGIVKDSLNLPVPGATVSLRSDKDTLKTSTSSEGIFVFRNVKSATYTIIVQSVGYRRSPPIQYKLNDKLPHLVMDPIILKEENNTLSTVVISGKPTIIYKTDTIEYKASNYVVKQHAAVDELLKKMEGMEVGSDGTLIHLGQKIKKAKVNGKEYLGGDIANAIRNLPAEIVDKIQIVDDYGDQAARTGVKDGDPSMILNITTRTDKSVGNMALVNLGGGNNSRYEAGIFANRLNGNEVISVNGNFSNTTNVSTGGTTNSGSSFLTWRDRLGKKVQMNLNYSYSGTNANSLINSSALDVTTISEINTIRAASSDNKSKNHTIRVELEGQLDSNNFFKITPSMTLSSSRSSGLDTLYRTGIQLNKPVQQNLINNNNSQTVSPQFGLSVLYQHNFMRKRRNFSLQADLNGNSQEMEQELINRILYLNATETVEKDSLLNRLIARKNLQYNYKANLTYVEPLTANTQLELNSQLNYTLYNNNAITRNDNTGYGFSAPIDSLSNIYKYSFTQARITLNYRFGIATTAKLKFSLGMTAVPTYLYGRNTSLGVSATRNSLNIIPVARFEYAFSRQHRLAFNYSGSALTPTFDQIQPVRDASNPQNPVIGNPDLSTTFTHSLNVRYDNYLANSKLNYSLDLNAAFTDNAVIYNNVQIPDTLNGFVTETRFMNIDGVYRMDVNYSINKQLDNSKYNLSFNGSLNFNHGISMINGLKNMTDTWTATERFGPRLTPFKWIEVYANISYNVSQSTNTLAAANSSTNNLALNLDGRFYIGESWVINYNASKNYISGISSGISSNPFVVNATVEKQLFDKRGKITFQVFDILNQNNYLKRTTNDYGGYVDTKSNALSRYFMVKLTMNLQKWSAFSGRNGDPVIRKGDGSFM